MNKVLIFGTFDIIHPGHVRLLREAKKYGVVHAVVSRDETAAIVKGEPPMHSMAERMTSLATYGVTVHPGSTGDKLETFKALRPDVVVLGYDQHRFVDQLTEHIRANVPNTRVITVPPLSPEIFKTKKIKAVLNDVDAGFLLIDKESGAPSFRLVTQLRKLLGIRQIGFAGTLDPLASGLLVFGTGRATTLLDWWHLLPKTYEAVIRLGVTSNTYDREGEIRAVSDRVPTQSELMSVIKEFSGTLMQKPPAFSAIKRAGVALYTLARQGIAVDVAPREITVYGNTLSEYSYPYVHCLISCSSGTYIRSIAHDIGERLGTGALLAELRRTAIGPFDVREAHTVAAIRADTWKEKCVPFEKLRMAVISALFPDY